jgi:ubiquitin carboxyl-terminal hydrolase 4/11/15
MSGSDESPDMLADPSVSSSPPEAPIREAPEHSIEEDYVEVEVPMEVVPSSGPEEEKSKVAGVGGGGDITLEEGVRYYLINPKWWEQWKDYVDFNGERRGANFGNVPEMIDNADIMTEDGSRIRPSVYEHGDYEILNEATWKLLLGWYGGGPEIGRMCIKDGYRCVLELYGLSLTAFKSSDLDTEYTVTVSKQSTIGDFKKQACKVMGLDDDKVRVWDYFQKQKYAHLEDMDKTLDDSHIHENNAMLLEEQGEDGKFAPKEVKKAWGTTVSYNEDTVVSQAGTGGVDGVCGLNNLGNTCFMASMLQCLNQTQKIKELFGSDAYKEIVNTDNPMGTGGKLADSYARLFQLMWSPNAGAVAPRKFKYEVGQFHSEFVGYGQQDSQELLQWLVDGLHEDLNSVQQKAYFEDDVVTEGRTDTEIADEVLSRHLQRNASRVHQIFEGQFKSTICCLTCDRKYLKFDPYTIVSLPLRSVKAAQEKVYQLSLMHFVEDEAEGAGSSESSRRLVCTQVKVSMSKDGSTVKQLKQKVCDECGKDIDTLVVVEVYNNRIFKFFQDSETCDSIKDNEVIVLYEVEDASAFAEEGKPSYSSYSMYDRTASPEPEKEEQNSASKGHVGVVLFQNREKTSSAYQYNSRYGNSRENFGVPLLLSLPADQCSAGNLYRSVISLVISMSADGAHREAALNALESYDTGARQKQREEREAKKQAELLAEVAEEDSKAAEGDDADADDAAESMESGVAAGGAADGAEDGAEGESEFAWIRTLALKQGDKSAYSSSVQTSALMIERFPDDDDEGTDGSDNESEGMETTPVRASEARCAALSTEPSNGANFVTVNWAAVPEYLLADTPETVGVKDDSGDEDSLTLEDSLQLYSETEVLVDAEQYYCSHCKEHRDVTKKMDLWSLPPVLVLHFKRFSYTRYNRDKLCRVSARETRGPR